MFSQKTLALAAVALVVSAGTLAAQTINLAPGNSIAGGTVIAPGSTVNVLGGDIGLSVDLSSGVLNVQSGNVAIGATSVATGFTNVDNTVNISGGNVGGFFQLIGNTDLNLSGGVIQSFGLFNDNTVANITGGTVTDFPDILDGTVNISGGNVNAVRVFGGQAGGNGANLNLFGTQFFIDGTPVSLSNGQAFTITPRNVTLSGLLADGSNFSFSLSDTFVGLADPNPGFALDGSTVTVTQVVGIPEPAALPMMLLALSGLILRRGRSAN